jgi:hypothetical protein
LITVLPFRQDAKVIPTSTNSAIKVQYVFNKPTIFKISSVISDTTNNSSIAEYLIQLQQKQKLLISLSSHYLEKQSLSRKNSSPQVTNPVIFSIGDYVLLSYPSRPPNKISPIYRGPLVIVDKDNDIYTCSDLITNKNIRIHADRLRLFVVPSTFIHSDILALAAADKDEFVVDSIISHTGTSKRNFKFQVRWLGYEPDEDTWLPYSEVKDLAALDIYSRAHPELALG